ncbi:MAG TPA: hypothetical protein VE985_11830 [Gaiellaceae bacterium]|nr:hypothetical protein [Gaiellaceae bacterium]
MKAKLVSVAVVLVALAAPAQALASGGGGAAQAALQGATTGQAALGASVSGQNAVNANVPVSIAGGNVNAGPSSATQTATSTATTNVANTANTNQNQTNNQTLGSSGCQAGCGGAGGFQAGIQNAQTQQVAIGGSKSDQNAVNANVPVSIAGGDVNSGPSSATQTASSTATTNVSNDAKTHQDQTQNQNIGGSSCQAGCGGAGGYQAGVQNAGTTQVAAGAAKSDQTAVNANVPVSVAGGDVNSGPSSATQTASSTATTNVSNDAKTHQDQTQNQNIGGSSCVAGCGGAGGFQAGIQDAQTQQFAVGAAKSDQNAVNANAPVSVAGGDVWSGPSTASQTANSTATTNVSNDAKTHQDQTLNQNIGGSSCVAGCGGAGGFQLGVQKADTEQAALGLSYSNQNAVNGNAPVAIAGGDVWSGPSTASQTATSTATTNVSNDAKTYQDQTLNQNLGGPAMTCGCGGGNGYEQPKGGCSAGCGGNGGFQLAGQFADTKQWAAGFAVSNQNAVNSNAPDSTAGGDIYGGSSDASQMAGSNAATGVTNDARTHQSQWQNPAPVWAVPGY